MRSYAEEVESCEHYTLIARSFVLALLVQERSTFQENSDFGRCLEGESRNNKINILITLNQWKVTQKFPPLVGCSLHLPGLPIGVDSGKPTIKLGGLIHSQIPIRYKTRTQVPQPRKEVVWDAMKVDIRKVEMFKGGLK